MTNPVKLGNRCKTIDGERLSTNPKRVREHDSFSYCFFYFYRVFTEFSKRERNEETSGRVRPLAFFFPIWNFFFDFVSILRSCQSANRWSDAPARLSERVSRQSIRRYRVFFFVIHSLVHSFGPRWRSRPFLIGRRRRLHLPNADGSLGPPSLGCQSLGYRVVTEFFFLRTVTVGRVASGHNNKNRLGKKKNSVKKLGRTPVDELGGGDLASF